MSENQPNVLVASSSSKKLAKLVSTKSKEEKEEDKEFLCDFIATYESLPILWNNKLPEYHNKPQKNAAQSTLLEKYQERWPSATIHEAMAKLNSMRTAYRLQKRKMQESAQSGAGSDEVYQPTLWCFRYLAFLDDIMEPTKSLNSDDVIDLDNTEDVSKIILYYQVLKI